MSSSSSLNNVRNLPESSHYQPPLPPTQSTISKPLPLLNDFLITPPKHQLQQQQQPSLPTLDSKLFDLPSPNTNVPIIIPSSSTDHSSPLPSTQPSSSLPTAKQSTSSSSDTLDTLNEPIYDTIVSSLYHP